MLVVVGVLGIRVEVLVKLCNYISNLRYVCIFLFMRFVDPKFSLNLLAVLNFITFRELFTRDMVCSTTSKEASKRDFKLTKIIWILYLVVMKFV